MPGGDTERPVLLINDSNGFFTTAPGDAIPMPDFQIPGGQSQIGKGSALVSDFNSDGHPDLVLQIANAMNGNEIQLLLNDGTGFFTDQTLLLLPQPNDSDSRTKVWMVDLDGDGDDELLTGTFEQLEFYLNDGNGSFSAVDPNSLEFGWYYIPVDVDKNGYIGFIHHFGPTNLSVTRQSVIRSSGVLRLILIYERQRSVSVQ